MTDTASWPAWRCPQDRGPLERIGDTVFCANGHRHEVRGGIVRFASDGRYAGAFGAQWNRYRRTQLDSYTGLPLSRERLQSCLGEAVWGELARSHVLECGCGAGRFTEVLLAEGALVTSVDLSDAVEANQTNCPMGTTHRIAQADIMALPFEPRQFHIVLSLGVIQHTPNSEAAIAALYEQVRPGGYLVIDHYAPSLSALTRVGELPRLYLRRLPAGEALRHTERIVDTLLPLHKRLRKFQRLLSRLSPVNSYYHRHPDLSDEIQREWALLDTHDHLTDYYKRFRTRGSIERTLSRLGLESISCERGGNGVEARGRRPRDQWPRP